MTKNSKLILLGMVNEKLRKLKRLYDNESSEFEKSVIEDAISELSFVKQELEEI